MCSCTETGDERISQLDSNGAPVQEISERERERERESMCSSFVEQHIALSLHKQEEIFNFIFKSSITVAETVHILKLFCVAHCP